MGLQLGGDRPIRWIDAVVLKTRKIGGVARLLQCGLERPPLLFMVASTILEQLRRRSAGLADFKRDLDDRPVGFRAAKQKTSGLTWETLLRGS